MSDIIQILPDAVANQIAAGEVIQRPASAVKELLENAVDSGAASIRLIAKDAGRTLIHVVDDGCGMSATDARRSFERHATSKIRSAEDLFAIRTRGFRGEALASVAAIAQVEMKTRRTEDEVGTGIVVEASSVKSQSPAACPAGTGIMVKNLFYNVPARRNFLKSNPVETRHIIEEFLRVAIAHPEIRFTFHHNEEEVYHLPVESPRQRLVSVYGKSYNERLVPVEEETAMVKIGGFIGKPEFSRKTRGEQFFFVNSRFIRSPYLHHAVQNAYRELVRDDAYPSYFIFLDVDPASIDINIHPTKTEVKFEDEKSVYAIINSAVRRSLGRYNITPTLDFGRETAFDDVASPGGRPVLAPRVSTTPGYNPFRSPDAGAARKAGTEELYAGLATEEEVRQHVIAPAWEGEEDESPRPAFQLHNRYILSQIKSGLMIIDQQAAHERILYERFLAQLEAGKGPSQQLLFPETVELGRENAMALQEMAAAVRALGFDMAPSGAAAFEVRGVPPELKEGDVSAQLERFAEQCKGSAGVPVLDGRDALARTLAHNLAVKAGRRLSAEETEALIDHLFACRDPYTSPHGRPTLTTITLAGLEKKFGG